MGIKRKNRLKFVKELRDKNSTKNNGENVGNKGYEAKSGIKVGKKKRKAKLGKKGESESRGKLSSDYLLIKAGVKN